MSNKKETILARSAPLAELLDKNPSAYDGMYRTKDIYLVAYLNARGVDWFGLEKVQIEKTFGSKGKNESVLLFFLFENGEAIRKAALNYYNNAPTSLNVNANIFVRSYQNVRSVITNPPL